MAEGMFKPVCWLPHYLISGPAGSGMYLILLYNQNWVRSADFGFCALVSCRIIFSYLKLTHQVHEETVRQAGEVDRGLDDVPLVAAVAVEELGHAGGLIRPRRGSRGCAGAA